MKLSYHTILPFFILTLLSDSHFLISLGHSTITEEVLPRDTCVCRRAQEHSRPPVFFNSLIPFLGEGRTVSLGVFLFRQAGLLGPDPVQIGDPCGIDPAGAHGVHQYAILSQFPGQSLAHAHHTHTEGVGQDQIVQGLSCGSR